MTRVLLVDDQASFRSGLRALFTTVPGFEVIGEASDGRDALVAVERLRPEVVLMDVRMPRVNGVAATAAIRKRWPATCVLVVTTFDDDETVADAMRAGAAGYLLKGTPIEDIAQIIALALRGYTSLGPGVTRRADGARSDPPADARSADDARRLAALSQRERGILELIAQGCTNREVAQRLALTEGTVKNYISGILGALQMRHRTQAALLWRAVHARPPEPPCPD